MPIRGRISGALGVAILLCSIAVAASANNQIWRGTGGVTAFSFQEARLEAVDLSVERIGPAGFDGPHAFRVRNGAEVFFRVRDGSFAGFLDSPLVLAHDGGFVLHAPSRSTVMPGFSVEIEPSGERLFARIRGADDAAPALEVRNTGFWFDPAHGQLLVRGGDLTISPEWANRMGRPELAGWWLGAVDLRLDAQLVREELAVDPAPLQPEGTPTVLDVLLHEVYGMTQVGRLGTYPTGVLGLAFATTACNNGNVDVPWHAPMAEDHPFMTLAMFRDSNGRMEMIGKAWTKHGFYALANDQCFLGCGGGGGGYLAIGCSDTYSVANNSSQFYLGPPEEVNPYTAVWHCLGSWFDGTPVDCVRDEFGTGLDPVAHRLEVWEDELLVPGAEYYYEGIYYVMDDDSLSNNWRWQKCAANWGGSSWSFPDLGPFGGYSGPFMLTWGDQQDTGPVAPDDGILILSTKVTDNGNGTWHYEYALYNQTSDRGVEAFTVPVGAATLTNVGFHDVDRDPGTDWTFSTAGGQATWETAAFGTPTPSYPLTYQTMFNFRFDADHAPQAASAQMTLHKPGIGTVTFLDTQSPGGATGAWLAGEPTPELALFPNEPNPFREATGIRFALGAEQPVRLVVTDVTGRTVRTLLDGTAPAGETSLRWNARDDGGRRVASGIYFFRLETEQRALTVKGVLLR